ncbi:MAG: hypothetical protein ACP5IC_02905 [Minisyncoccia bacterium]
MTLYIYLNKDISKPDENYGKVYLTKKKLIVYSYDIFKSVLNKYFSFKEEKLSIWKYDTNESLGELVASDGNIDLLLKEAFGIAKISGKLKLNGKELPMVLEFSVDKEYSDVYGDINLDLTLEYGGLCDYLDSLSKESYQKVKENIFNLLKDFNYELTEKIKKEGFDIKDSIDYAYISRIPENQDDVIELYIIYKPRGDLIKEVLKIMGKSIIENDEIEENKPWVIKTRKSKLYTVDNIVNFISSIKEVKNEIQKIIDRNIVVDTTHSIVLDFSNNKDNRIKIYDLFKNNIFIPFLELLPENDKLKKDYINKILNRNINNKFFNS